VTRAGQREVSYHPARWRSTTPSPPSGGARGPGRPSAVSQTLAGVGRLRRDTLVLDELNPECRLVNLSLGPVGFRALRRPAVRVAVHPTNLQETLPAVASDSTLPPCSARPSTGAAGTEPWDEAASARPGRCDHLRAAVLTRGLPAGPFRRPRAYVLASQVGSARAGERRPGLSASLGRGPSRRDVGRVDVAVQ
jgi:hypothetical protein